MDSPLVLYFYDLEIFKNIDFQINGNLINLVRVIAPRGQRSLLFDNVLTCC